jgi:glycosidase
LITLIQFTYVGAPMIYYGDEVGMWGADDPNNRKPMLWDDLEPYEDSGENHIMKEILTHYKALIALRKEHPSLRRGSIRTVYLHDDDDVWAFMREHEDEQILVGMNASENERTITMPEGTWESLHGSGSTDDSIKGLSGRVWLRTR